MLSALDPRLTHEVTTLGVSSSKARNEPMEGVLKVITLAMRIATAWALLSLLLTALWVVSLEVRRRSKRGPASKPAAREEQQLSLE
jgi:hypothetical protein